MTSNAQELATVGVLKALTTRNLNAPLALGLCTFLFFFRYASTIPRPPPAGPVRLSLSLSLSFSLSFSFLLVKRKTVTSGPARPRRGAGVGRAEGGKEPPRDPRAPSSKRDSAPARAAQPQADGALRFSRKITAIAHSDIMQPLRCPS